MFFPKGNNLYINGKKCNNVEKISIASYKEVNLTKEEYDNKYVWMDTNRITCRVGNYEYNIDATTPNKVAKTRTTVIFTDNTEVQLTKLTGWQSNGLITGYGGEIKEEVVSTKIVTGPSERLVFYPKDNILYVNEAYENHIENLNIFKNVKKVITESCYKETFEVF